MSWPNVSVELLRAATVYAARQFGGVGISLALPIAAKTQTSPLWDVPAAGVNSPQGQPGGLGSHFTPSGRWDGKNLWLITWGVEVAMTPAFFVAYAIAVDTGVSPLWLSTLGMSPAGLDLSQLRKAARSFST